MTTDPFLIVGGGIGGLAAALAIAKTNRPVRVLERASEFLEIGAGIQLGPNGLKMLDRLGLTAQVDALCVRPERLTMMDGVTGGEVTSIPLGDAFIARFGYQYLLIHRADLHGALLSAARNNPLISLETGQELVGFEDGDASVTVRLAGGASITGSGLIGADGLWSKIRADLLNDGPPRVSGHIAYRAVLPIEDIPEAFRQQAMILWAGPKNHLVQYPLRGGKLFNLVAVFHSDRYVEGWNTQGSPDELRRCFSGTCATVQALLDKVETWRLWVLCDREPVKEFSRGHVTLLGDAAHPMLQYLAQGACMAMEDGLVLADALEAEAAVPRAFESYQQQRYLRTAKCQVLARVYGEFYHASGVVAELRNAFLASRDRATSYESLAWLYDF